MEKILYYEDLPWALEKIKSHGPLVLVGGCFDILHPGHHTFLKEAKKQGETLLVMLESDQSVTERKGPSRPINTQELRAKTLAQVADVDYILLLPYLETDSQYYSLVKNLQPDIIAVTASDPAYDKKSEQAEIVGGKVAVVVDRLPQHSTTKVLEQKS